MPISAVDSITPALEHTRRQLFGPFRIGQWTKLALVGMLAGELGSSGFHSPGFPTHPGSQPGIPGLPVDHALLAALITALVIGAFAVGIIFAYISSVMRFVLFDSVVTRECHIRQSWSRRLTPGWHYFVFKLLYAVLSLAAIALVVGIPLALAFLKGWFREPKEHLAFFIVGGILVGLALIFFAIATAVIFTLIKDFVVPLMALEDLDVAEGWSRLWAMMQAETGAYVGYIGMKIVLGFVASIMVGIATLILGLIFVLPTVGLSILAVITGKAAGLTWNVHTIALAVIVGAILLAVFLFLVSLIAVPVIVFFPAYSLHFFAGRYPRLSAVLYPAAGGPIPFAVRT